MTPDQLVGRGAELARLGGLIREARSGRPSTVVLRGEPGSGKSALLAAFATMAADAGFQVAAADARCVPEEPFALAGDVLRSLLAPGAAVAPGADRLPSPEALYGLVELVRERARRVPVAVCVDGMARADAWSWRWLSALSGSASPEPLVVAVAGGHFGVGHPSRWEAELTARARHIDLGGLPVSALTGFAAERCGVTLDEDSAAVCGELTGGNPGLLLALLSGHTGAAPTAEDLRGATAAAVPPDGGPWLGGLGDPALALARAVAVLGADAEIAGSARLARMGVREALPVVDELVGRCLLANRTPLEFRHPLLAAMVIGGIPAGTRTALHLRAAEILRDGHCGAAGVVGVARQLAAAGPLGLGWTVRPLRIAARRLTREGRTEEAAEYLRTALRERLRPGVRSAVRCELAELEAFADPELTVRQLDAARRETGDPGSATDYAVLLARLLTDRGRPADAVAVLDDTADRLGTAAPAHSRRLRLHKAAVRLGGPAAQAGDADRPEDLAAELPDRDGGHRELAGLLAADAVRAGQDRAAAVRHAKQALAGGVSAGRGADGRAGCLWYGCGALIRADELAWASTYLSRFRLPGGTRPGRWEDVTAELLRAMICRVRGELAGVEAVLAPMADLLCAAASGSRLTAAPAVAALVEARALTGETDAALALLTGSGLDHDPPPRQEAAAVLSARAALWEQTGDLPRALGEHLAAGRLLTECRVRNPAVVPWRSHAARLLAASGDTTRAGRLAGAELADAHRWGTPRTIGVAEHAAAMAETGARRVGLLSTAVGTLSRSPARLELAAARYDLGATLSETGRPAEARAQFAAALSVAGACGAQPLAHRIASALRTVCPARAHEPVHPCLADLTPQELKILCLARAGHTNRAIAAKLFLTVRTVEFHLSGAYRKLGISGRRQLAEIIPAAAEAPSMTAAVTAAALLTPPVPAQASPSAHSVPIRAHSGTPVPDEETT